MSEDTKMQSKDLASWEEFVSCVGELRKQHELGLAAGLAKSPLLFRGQGDATWLLTTTLERFGKLNMKFTAYYQAASRLSSEIETLTGNNWELPPYPEMDEKLRDYFSLSLPLPTSVYRYMLFLRHHGFPSPLLDWSRSPYVAAYFAFRYPLRAAGGMVSIYAFSETPEGFKTKSNADPQIIRVGPYLRSHRRHFLQQSDYTFCVFFDNMWRFRSHDEVFDLNDPHQDHLIKINLPSSERLKVLRLLDDHNLNAFSLFGSEESLMETMAVRALEFAD